MYAELPAFVNLTPGLYSFGISGVKIDAYN